jgi:hypothetical protein
MITFLFTQFSPASCHFISLRSKCKETLINMLYRETRKKKTSVINQVYVPSKHQVDIPQNAIFITSQEYGCNGCNGHFPVLCWLSYTAEDFLRSRTYLSPSAAADGLVDALPIVCTWHIVIAVWRVASFNRTWNVLTLLIQRVTPCNLVENYKHFRRAYFLHLYHEYGSGTSSGTLIGFYQTTRRHIPENNNLHSYRRELVEALCYKPEGHGFDSRWGRWIFQLT